MKLTTQLLCSLLIAVTFVACNTTKHHLTRTEWQLSNAKASETTISPETPRRTMEFTKKGTFTSFVNSESGPRNYNSGQYAIVNDTILVTIHDVKGEHPGVANYYNFHVNKDTLHFYGNYIESSPHRNVATKIFIEELWVNSKNQ